MDRNGPKNQGSRKEPNPVLRPLPNRFPLSGTLEPVRTWSGGEAGGPIPTCNLLRARYDMSQGRKNNYYATPRLNQS